LASIVHYSSAANAAQSKGHVMRSGFFSSYVPWVGAFFIAIGILSFFTKAPLLGGALLCSGVAFLMLGGSAQAWPTLPPWRRIGSVVGIAIGMVLLVASLIVGGI
jgi:hypothetical protein